MKNYKCICGKEFDHIWELREHQETCTDYHNLPEQIEKDKEYEKELNEEYICEVCGKHYKWDGKFLKGGGYKHYCSRSCQCKVTNKNNFHQNQPKTEEQKRKMSESHKKRWECMTEDARLRTKLALGFIKRPNQSHPEMFWSGVLQTLGYSYEENKLFVKGNYEKEASGHWFLDFLIEDKINLEIDSSYHDEEADAERDAFITNRTNYEVYRIKWTGDKKLRAEQIELLKKFLEEKLR